MILSIGAEAVIEKEKGIIIKRRIRKRYRIKEIDEFLRKKRTRNEAKLMIEARRAGINVPKIFEVNEKDFTIKMEFVKGERLSDNNEITNCEKIGETVKKLHSVGIIHGDLTTSNMINSEGKIFLIDFSLGFFSKKVEDKAVDLILLKRAIETRHSNWESCWKKIIKIYDNFDVITRMKAIEKRWRYHK